MNSLKQNRCDGGWFLLILTVIIMTGSLFDINVWITFANFIMSLILLSGVVIFVIWISKYLYSISIGNV